MTENTHSAASQAPKSSPGGAKTAARLIVKLGLTVLVFYMLLTHRIAVDGQQETTIYEALSTHLGQLDFARLWPWLLLAITIKIVGIFSSMLRWHLLLIGQGIAFNFGHLVGSFLIGRFLGTFLPSTIGLDGYKLYDAARFSGRGVEAAAATAIEKVFGLMGIFLTFLVALPFGLHVLGEQATMVATITVPLSILVLGGFTVALWRPGWVRPLISMLPTFGEARALAVAERLQAASAAYRGRLRLLAAALGLSFMVHFTTAAMYYFTAVAIGAQGAQFWPILFASSIQIFATVISPFTIAGEGVREIVQALLLARHIGVSESILSAALGFWAAEALTMAGAVFLLLRQSDYKPKRCAVSVLPE